VQNANSTYAFKNRWTAKKTDAGEIQAVDTNVEKLVTFEEGLIQA
jgi:hypothetical protein